MATAFAEPLVEVGKVDRQPHAKYDKKILTTIEDSDVYRFSYAGRQPEDVYEDIATLVRAENTGAFVPLDMDLINDLYELAISMQPANKDARLRFDKKGGKYEFDILRTMGKIDSTYLLDLRSAAVELKSLYGFDFDAEELTFFYDQDLYHDLCSSDLKLMQSLVIYYDDEADVKTALAEESMLMDKIEEIRDYDEARYDVQKIVLNKKYGHHYDCGFSEPPVATFEALLKVQNLLGDESPLKISGAKGTLGEAAILSNVVDENMFDNNRLVDAGVVNALYGIEFEQADLDTVTSPKITDYTIEDLEWASGLLAVAA